MEPAKKKHSLMLDSRSTLVITGAEEVNGFNEETVSVRTSEGTLIIKGSGLHIDKLNLETGDVSVDGKINSDFVVYTYAITVLIMAAIRFHS